MEIVFNGVTEIISHTESLLNLLTKKEMSQKTGIAVAVNQNVIPRNEWEKHSLQDKDTIIVIKATQGG